MADVNGDGLADFIYDSDGTNKAVHVLLSKNTGDGFAADAVWGSRTADHNVQSPGIRMADVNGDGLADVIYNGPLTVNSHFRVLISRGDQFLPEADWGVRIRGYEQDCPGGFRMADVNGDGLADVIFQSGGSTDPGIYVKLSTGAGFTGDAFWRAVDKNYKTGSKGFQMADVTGDGIPEIIYNSGAGTDNVRVIHNDAAFPDLLSTVKNSLGGIYQLEYWPSTKYEDNLLPYVVQTVHSLSIMSAEGAQPSVSYYTYSGGYHDLEEREFRGFNKVSQLSPSQVTTNTFFYQGRAGEPHQGLKGLPYRQEVLFSDGSPYKISQSSYDVSAPASGVLFPHLATQQESLYDGVGAQGTPKTTTVEFGYDGYGNLLRKYSYGYTNDAGDDVEETTTYKAADLTRWLLALPEDVYVKGTSINSPSALSLVSHTTFEYESNSARVFRKTFHLDGVNDPVITYTYEKPNNAGSTGNVETIKDPMGKVTTTVYESTHTFPQIVMNAAGHTVSPVT